jgi:hypothetical protein
VQSWRRSSSAVSIANQLGVRARIDVDEAGAAAARSASAEHIPSRPRRAARAALASSPERVAAIPVLPVPSLCSNVVAPRDAVPMPACGGPQVQPARGQARTHQVPEVRRLERRIRGATGDRLLLRRRFFLRRALVAVVRQPFPALIQLWVSRSCRCFDHAKAISALHAVSCQNLPQTRCASRLRAAHGPQFHCTRLVILHCRLRS